ncbi:MAG: antibiotic biosynthesis monooxygenase [Caulobacteraceae bacterium]
MIGLMARLRVKDGHEAAFEAAFQALAERVHNDEPGAVLYQLTRSRTAGHYVVMELYPRPGGGRRPHQDAAFHLHVGRGRRAPWSPASPAISNSSTPWGDIRPGRS